MPKKRPLQFLHKRKLASPLLDLVGATESTAAPGEGGAVGEHAHLRLEQFLQQVPDFAVIVDSAGLLQFANHVALQQIDHHGACGIRYVDCFTTPEDQPVEEWFRQARKLTRACVFETAGADGSNCLHYVVPLPRQGAWDEVVYLQVQTKAAERAPRAGRPELCTLQRFVATYEEHSKFTTRELHDGVTRPLAAAIRYCETLLHEQGKPSDVPSAGLGEVTDLLKTTLTETRRLMSGLRPAALDDFGLLAALDQLVTHSQALHHVEIDWRHNLTAARLPRTMETGIYRIIEESLANSLRYSGSATIAITLTQWGGGVRINCQDWGRGFDPHAVGVGHWGLRGIQERVRSLGGTVHVDSRPGGGTRIRVEIPPYEST